MQLQQGTGTSAKEIETSQGISQQNGLCYFQRVGTRGVNMSICHLIVTCIFISYNLRDNKTRSKKKSWGSEICAKFL
jgi:hypothetical protein